MQRMKHKNIIITKASGTQEAFSSEKLRHSLAKSGANEATIDNILTEIESTLYDGISTKKIYQAAFNMLKRGNRSHAGRYNLKRAIMALGPSGFPFEKYVAAIFEWQGYKVQTQLFLKGSCVTHEIDVLAENDTEFLLIECKYHNSVGIVSDVKIPLYIHSRYQDVLINWSKTSTTKPLNCCLVTNTKFSSDAITYGNCIGIKLLGWDYPSKKSLSSLIDKSGLYPITCLTTLTNKEKENVLAAGTVLCSSLLQNETLLNKQGIGQSRMTNIIAEIKSLCKY
jgi:Holliday junction resolvase